MNETQNLLSFSYITSLIYNFFEGSAGEIVTVNDNRY